MSHLPRLEHGTYSSVGPNHRIRTMVPSVVLSYTPHMTKYLKKITLIFIARLVVPVVEEVAARAGLTTSNQGVIRTLRIRAVESSADYAQQHMFNAMAFPNRYELWKHVCDERFILGINLEFGVANGESIRFFAKKLNNIYGFDSFEGLQENWIGTSVPKGFFDRKGRMPKVPKNVTLVKGWFSDSLPDFLQVHKEAISFCHLDADTYESTSFVLDQIKERIKPGTIIIFDEYFCYNGWQHGEFKAWQEFVVKHKTRYEYLAFTHMSVAIRIL